MKILDFKTEYCNSPVGIDVSPRFTWRADLTQKSFRLEVKKLGATVFDTGTVFDCDTIGLEYGGEPLCSDSLYTVRLTCTAENGSQDRLESRFETGLLSSFDWKGAWVSMPANFSGQCLLARKSFELSTKAVARAVCYVSGLGYHEFYANGIKIGNAVLRPDVSDTSKRVYYHCYSVADCLLPGENVIGIMLGSGWQGEKQLLVQLNIQFEDGTVHEEYTANGMWWCTGGAITRESIYGGETFDARRENIDWCKPSFQAGWHNGWMYLLRSLHPPAGKPVCTRTEDIRITDTFEPVMIFKHADGNVYDFGQNISGWCRVRAEGGAGDRITMVYGEQLTDSGGVNQLNLRAAAAYDEFILKGEGTEEYAPRFTYHGFRYVQVRTEGEVSVLHVLAEHVHTDVRKCGEFHCSDPVLNRLHRMAYYTELNNLHGIMTDCPQRDERFMWLNDLSSRVYQTANNVGMERMFSKILNDISDTQDERGAIADTAPYFTAQRPADPVCVCYLLFALFAYRRYGDRRSITEHYDNLKAWTEFLLTRQTGFISDYSYYGDWVKPPVYEENPSDGFFISSVYLYWHLISMSEIARIAGNESDRLHYFRLAGRSKVALNRKYYHADTKSYDNGSQGSNAVALSLGLAPQQDAPAVAKNIVEDIRRKGMHSSCGNQTYRHLFYCLSDYGYTDELINMITNPQYPGWGYMAASGATTVWERWEKEMQNEMHSFNHPMFASYDAWFYEYLGGIRIAHDAYACNRILLSPKTPAHLNDVKCSLSTLRGPIVSEWRRRGERIQFHFVVPCGITAQLRLPGKILSGNYREQCLPVYLTGGAYHIECEAAVSLETDFGAVE